MCSTTILFRHPFPEPGKKYDWVAAVVRADMPAKRVTNTRAVFGFMGMLDNQPVAATDELATFMALPMCPVVMTNSDGAEIPMDPSIYMALHHATIPHIALLYRKCLNNGNRSDL